MRARNDYSPYLLPSGVGFMAPPEQWKGKPLKEYTENWWKHAEMVVEEKPIDKGSIEKLTRDLAKRAGVEKANPHKFRRTCATMALRHGMPVEQVSKMLGHEQITTTQIYLDLQEGELAQAHKKYVF